MTVPGASSLVSCESETSMSSFRSPTSIDIDCGPAPLASQITERHNRRDCLQEFRVTADAKELTRGLIMIDQRFIRFQRDYALLQSVQNDMQPVFCQNQVVDVPPHLLGKMVERQAQLAELVLPAFVRADGKVPARHGDRCVNHAADGVCHPARNKIRGNRHARRGDQRAQHQRAHKAHQRAVDFVGRPRHHNGSDDALHIIRNGNADHNAVLRKPLGGDQFFPGVHDFFAGSKDGVADNGTGEHR